MRDRRFTRSIQEHRTIVANLNCPIPPAELSYKHYPDYTVYRPPGVEAPFPTVFYIPGNAFVASETSYTHSICSRIALQSGCQLIVLKHRLAPEYKAPIPFEDVQNITARLLVNSANTFHIDKSRVAICGYSSGGNLAALLTIHAKKQGWPIARQILISPVTDLSRSLKNFEKYQNQDTAITEAFVRWFLRLYLRKGENRANPLLSPAWVSNQALQGLPPTDIVVGEYDRFRGDAEHYGQRLIEQNNMLHMFKVQVGDHSFLWQSMLVVNAVSASLTLSIGAGVSIERHLSLDHFKVNVIRLGAIKKQMSQETPEDRQHLYALP